MAVNDATTGAKSTAQRVLAFGQRQVDRAVRPETRQKAYDSISAFAQERPILFSFIASQLFFSLLPLLVFAAFAVSTVGFALVSAALFSVFWLGVALLFLVPALFFTFSIAVLVWLWAVATFLVGRWVYQKTPLAVRGQVAVKAPVNKEVFVRKPTPDGFRGGDVKVETEGTKE
ncbi:hypothetical protein DL765_002270 [Monosporascus sp. GIB2]|nr:hypothetical protein DL765_002270 [Monosporascus sp. GIB2]